MLDFLKENLHPADITCILLLLAPGTALLFVPSLARWGRRWLAAVVLGYAVISTQAGATLLSRTLSYGYRPIQSAAEAEGAQAIVVLGGGSVNLRASGRQLSVVATDAGLRVLEAARLFALLNGPALSGAAARVEGPALSGAAARVEGPVVIASGGITERDPAAAPESAALQRALVEAGVPPDRILLESESKNTRDEVIIIKRMLAERNLTRFILITSPLHMRRSMLAFEQQGLHPIPSPARLVPERSNATGWLWPSEQWLSVADAVIYEWLARGYYWWKGWLG
jgi:uncharacterized SAM-binding protein YcdF (DUF218 family)